MRKSVFLDYLSLLKRHGREVGGFVFCSFCFQFRGEYLIKLLKEADKVCMTGCKSTSVGKPAKTLAKKFPREELEMANKYEKSSTSK